MGKKRNASDIHQKVRKLSPIYNTNSRWYDAAFVEENFKRTYFPYLLNVNSMQEIFDKLFF